MIIKNIINEIEIHAPPIYQENYDNAGLLTGNPKNKIDSALISLDVTEEVVDEAVKNGCGLIISHHPVIFKGLKKLTGSNYVERTIINAVKNNIAIYAAHTNLDTLKEGTNQKISDKLHLKNTKVINPGKGLLRKIAVFVPRDHADKVRNAAFNNGAGQIGDYNNCSFNSEGKGSFKPGENTNPFKGKIGNVHLEDEIKIEIAYPVHLQSRIVNSILEAHPYEEVAYDIFKIENSWDNIGIGMIGKLDNPLSKKEFLNLVKEKINNHTLKYTECNKNKISKVAVCGGSGSFLIKSAKSAGADALITSDIKYHEFFDAENEIMLVDAGHYETEQFTKDWFYDVIHKKFPKFAVRFSKINTNPVKYY